VSLPLLRSHVRGAWAEGGAPGETLVNPATEEPLAQAAGAEIDRRAVLDYARTRGGPALRALSFAERGVLLKAMCDAMRGARS
jgi:oxepin-CoA hydrolase/3-oxo-5,6-dehydrosuberyl-CoA semialdehyde dehydrogenase